MTPYVVVLVNRLAELAEEQEAIEATLSARAGEWYRQDSGRTHFHPLQFKYMADGNLVFFTPIREDEIEVIIPIDWFNSKNPVRFSTIKDKVNG